MRLGLSLLWFVVAIGVLVACRAERAAPTGEPKSPTGATSTMSFSMPPSTAPPPWSSLALGPVVREPFSGPGNQGVMAATANGEGFVVVGEDFQSDANVNGAIWTSPNAHDWARLDTAANGLTGAVLDYVATSGKRLVAVGQPRTGADVASRPAGIVWTSDDGASWRRINAATPFGSAAIGGITAGPSSFVAWGVDGVSAVIFRSTDGATWTKTTDDRAFANMRVGDVKPYRGGFVAVGFYIPPNARTSVGGSDPAKTAAWWTADGVTWQAASTDEGFGLGSVNVGAAGLMALGPGPCGGCVGLATMWRSDDGRHWTHVGDDVPNWPAYVSDGARMIRYDWQGGGDVFESVDGGSWQKVGTTGRLSVYNLALGPHGILIVDSISPGAGAGFDQNDGAVRFVAAR
jgi:hypothetical protein